MVGYHVHLRTPFLHLRNGWTDCAENWCVVRPLATHFTQDGDIFSRAHETVHIYPLPLVHRLKGALLVKNDRNTFSTRPNSVVPGCNVLSCWGGTGDAAVV